MLNVPRHKTRPACIYTRRVVRDNTVTSTRSASRPTVYETRLFAVRVSLWVRPVVPGDTPHSRTVTGRTPLGYDPASMIYFRIARLCRTLSDKSPYTHTSVRPNVMLPGPLPGRR